MKIRRKSEKTVQPSVDGVPPLHTLITCTYQKLFKKEGSLLLLDSNGASPPLPGCSNGARAHGTSDQSKPPRPHERGSSWRVREAKLEGADVGGAREEKRHHGKGDGHDLDAARRANPLLAKRRKIKSTRYAEFSDKFSDEMIHVTPRSTTKAEKRSQKGNVAAEEAADYINTVANSKEALIASIFYVFDTLGESGLTASEVVAIMLDQTFPGLKEGGARHTVQVANVLRRSRHFISIGNKKYLPCSVVEDPRQQVRKQGRNHGGQASKGCKQGRPVCKLYDGSGWFCPREAHAGFSLCVHHLDMINRPLGKVQATPSALKDPPVNVVDSDLPIQQEGDQDSDSDHEDSGDIGPALANGGRDRTPGSVPNQKRKMLSLCSIK